MSVHLLVLIRFSFSVGRETLSGSLCNPTKLPDPNQDPGTETPDKVPDFVNTTIKQAQRQPTNVG